MDSLASATGPVSLVTNQITPGILAGLSRDWFDVLKQLASRPCGPDKLRIVLGQVPSAGSEAAGTVIYHRIAELTAIGAKVECCDGRSRQASTLIIRDGDGAVQTVWKWPWSRTLGPDVDDVQRNRLGLEQEAMALVEPEPAAKPLVLPRLREFNEFTLEPGKRHNLFSSRLLGNLLKHYVAGAVVIDPHILHNSQQIGMLEGFLRVLKIVPEIAVKVKASRVRGDERRGNFTSWSEQKKAADDLARRLATYDKTAGTSAR